MPLHIKRFDGNTFADSLGFSSIDIDPYPYFIDTQGFHWTNGIFRNSDGNWIDGIVKSNLSSSREEFPLYIADQFYEFQPDEIVFTSSNTINTIKNSEISTEDIYEWHPALPKNARVLNLESKDIIWVQTGSFYERLRLFKVSPAAIDEYIMDTEFVDQDLEDMKVDCEDNLTILSHSQILKRNGNQWTESNLETFNEDCYFSGFIDTQDPCDIWVRGRSRCRSVWQLKEEQLHETDILSDNFYTSAFDQEGNLYGLSLSVNGLIRIDTVGARKVFPIEEGFSTRRALHVTDNNEVIVSSISGYIYLYKLENEKMNLIATSHSVFATIDNWIYEDSQGHLWFHDHPNRIVEYDGQHWHYHNFELDVMSITEDSLQNFWFSTRDNGIHYWDRENLTSYNTLNSGLLSNYCVDLKLAKGHLWVNHQYGLSKMKLAHTCFTRIHPKAALH